MAQHDAGPLNTPGNAEASSSKSPLEASCPTALIEPHDPDELVWLGGHGSHEEQHDERDLVPEDPTEVWCREEWDCPTDILYHHAENDDGHVVDPLVPERPTADTGASIGQIQSKADLARRAESHPMFAHLPYDDAALRAVKEPYDPLTWDSPTDILYSHAEHDLVAPSALGIHLDDSPTLGAFSPSHLLGAPAQLRQAVEMKRNAFGVPREPYNAATWDSPTDILYCHGRGDEEDRREGKAPATAGRRGGLESDPDHSDSDGAASPYTPYSALARTPGDSSAYLPALADDASDGGLGAFEDTVAGGGKGGRGVAATRDGARSARVV